MHFPTTRVLTVLELLQSRKEMSGQELAERLEVDQRTVRRYITMLQDMGIPVESRRGRYGAYRLRPGFKLPPLMLRNDEAFALTIGLITAQKMALAGTAPAVESVLAKVVRILPVTLQEQVQAIQDALIFDAVPEQHPPISEIVVTLCMAVQQSHSVHIRYQSWNAPITERVIDPYGVVYRSGFWYTPAYCHLRNDVRTFRLDRMLSAELCADSFTPPENFDCVAHVNHSIALMPVGWNVEVLLQTTLEEAQCHISPAMAMLEQEAEGVALRCNTESLEWIARVLIGLRYPFTVRKPPELRNALREIAQQILTSADQGRSTQD